MVERFLAALRAVKAGGVPDDEVRLVRSNAGGRTYVELTAPKCLNPHSPMTAVICNGGGKCIEDQGHLVGIRLAFRKMEIRLSAEEISLINRASSVEDGSDLRVEILEAVGNPK